MRISMLHPPQRGETRTPEQLWEQYQIEKSLAHSLRQASREERRSLYASAYNELFRLVPHHSQLSNKLSPAQRARILGLQMSLLRRWLAPNTVFLEVGAGDCALSVEVAKRVARVIAVDVSETITRSDAFPPNLTLQLSDGTSIPAPDDTVTVAYSNQLMEHLHPDDAMQQLANICRALAPGGLYICLTPNRLTGPHDISRYFDTIATGFHLREYTSTELIAMFRDVGFRCVHQYIRSGNTYARLPNVVTRWIEYTVEHLPRALSTHVTTTRFVRRLLEISLIARK